MKDVVASEKFSRAVSAAFSTPKVKEYLSKRAKKMWANPFTRQNLKSKLTGRKRPPEVAKAISDAQLGSKNHMWGKKRTEEAKKKTSERLKRYWTPEVRLKRADQTKGSKSHLWKGGKTKESKIIRGSTQYALWREAVFARDNWTCQKCGKRGVFIHAHHIKPFSTHMELRFAIDNGITVCCPCHELIHGRPV